MADREIIRRLEKASLTVKLNLLNLCNRELMHIGGDLSVCDVMTVIWQYAMNYDVANPDWEDRDRFVLSKGHAAAVTSFSQAAIGCYEDEEIFSEYGTDNGRFGMHSCNLANPYVDVSTGSLGHGFPIAGGIANALKKKSLTSRVFVVMGDGEQHEGSIWEAAMSSCHYKLGNLIAFIDKNGLSFDGWTKDYMNVDPLDDKWRAFGWNVINVDGHDINAIVNAIDSIPKGGSIPHVIICETVKGKGVSFMENMVGWHSGMISDEFLVKAKNELIKAYEEKWGEKYE